MAARKNEISGIVLTVLVFLAGSLFFVIFYPYHQFFAEQMQLFLLSSDYFFDCWTKPAALGIYLGDFFTQFYYLRGGGAIVITASLIISWLVYSAVIFRFNPKKQFSILALFPIALLFTLHLDVTYSLSITISYILSLTAFWSVSLVTNHRIRQIIEMIGLMVVYIIAGAAVYLFLLLCILFEWKQLRTQNNRNWVTIPLLIIVGVIIPVILRLPYKLTYEQSFLFPIINWNHQALLWCLLMAVSVAIIGLQTSFSHLYFWSSSSIHVIEVLLLLVIFACGIKLNADFELEKCLAIDSEIYFNHTTEAARLAQKYKPKGSVGAYLYNLANSYTGQMPELFQEGNQAGLNGLFLPIDNKQGFATITFASEVFYHLGDVNTSQHLAMLGMIFSPKHQTSRQIRRLAEINIINKEYDVAEKFLKVLEQSMFHRKWAKSMRKYLNNDELCEKTYWISEKRKEQPLSDEISKVNNPEKTLSLLLDKMPQNRTALNYLLIDRLMKKDLEGFSKLFFDHATEFRAKRIPTIFQQALLIQFMLDRDNPHWSNVNLEVEQVRKMNDYTQLFEKNRGNGQALLKDYGKTYWFYFHYAKI